MPLYAIAAISKNNVIGRQNRLPWHIADDLQYFRATTRGHTVIMGRRNYESIGKPLPQRRNIILTRDTTYTAPGTEVYHTKEAVLAALAPDEIAFSIGGAEIYALFLPDTTRLYITHVHAVIDGDVFFPVIDWSAWRAVTQNDIGHKEGNEYVATIVEYERI